MTRNLQALGLFCLIAFGLSGGLVAALMATPYAGSENGLRVVLTFYVVGPAVAAVVTHLWLRLPFDPKTLGVSIQPSLWLLGAWMLPAFIAIAALFGQKLLPGVSVSFDPVAHGASAPFSGALFFFGSFVMSVFYGVIINLPLSIAGELGWRGVLLRILAPFGFWPSALLTGFIVGTWSLPVVLVGGLYPHDRQAGFFMVLAYALLVAPLASFFRLMSGSVVSAGLLQASLTSFQRFVALFVLAGSDVYLGLTGVAGLVALLVANVLIVLPRWREADAELRRLAI
jgi:hypothetical protein